MRKSKTDINLEELAVHIRAIAQVGRFTAEAESSPDINVPPDSER